MHFPASEEAAERIRMMGEKESSIHMVGGTSMDELGQTNVDNIDFAIDLQEKYGVGDVQKLSQNNYLVVIQHPVTTEYGQNFKHIQETVSAIKAINMSVIWIMPNMDAGSDGVSKGIRQFRELDKPDFVHFFKSLSIEHYGPLLKNAACIVGNSSSGIRESAFLGTPSVNIGTRQNGRERGCNVIDVGYDAHEIVNAIKLQLNHGRYDPSHLYGDGLSSSRIVNALRHAELDIQKTITY